ncbi:MAG: dinitrogenase iron-molybdenum cofactor biosynthesis protein [Deltaproteobacteria bacterium]|nr:MAG: dinitrogenase iron-molybdenum cofactor biosynthesis protein [Deltaproteobacteria bacterium]
MKIAISSTGPDLDSEVDPRFGRCQYFMIVDPDDMSFEAVPNTNLSQGSGVGIQSAKVVADKGAEVVLTGNVGPKAYQTLSAAGLKIVTGVSGLIREAIQQYKNGQLQPSDQPNAQNHSGLQAHANPSQRSWPQQGPGTGFGLGQDMRTGGSMGMGRGMRCGCGMGMGRGMGRGLNAPLVAAPSGDVSTEDELASLKEDARMLSEQLEGIQKRIKELENEKP